MWSVLEAFQTGLAAFDDVRPAGPECIRVVRHRAVHFCCQEHAIALAVAFQRLAHKLLGCAPAINVCRVEEIDPLVDSAVNDSACIFEVGLLAEHHAAQNGLAHLHAGASEEGCISCVSQVESAENGTNRGGKTLHQHRPTQSG